MEHQKLKNAIRCVIYDCDGVLFDSLEANGRLYCDVSASIGRPPLSEEELRYVHSHTVFDAIHHISMNDPELEEKAQEALKRIDLKYYVRFLRMEPHLFETLAQLKERGILRVINTNRTTSMKYIVEDFNLRPYFEMVVTALDVKNPKPHPESIEKILAAFQLEKEEVLFIGDSEVDQGTAKASGVQFIAYKNKAIANEHFLEDHLDLLKII